MYCYLVFRAKQIYTHQIIKPHLQIDVFQCGPRFDDDLTELSDDENCFLDPESCDDTNCTVTKAIMSEMQEELHTRLDNQARRPTWYDDLSNRCERRKPFELQQSKSEYNLQNVGRLTPKLKKRTTSSGSLRDLFRESESDPDRKQTVTSRIKNALNKKISKLVKGKSKSNINVQQNSETSLRLSYGFEQNIDNLCPSSTNIISAPIKYRPPEGTREASSPSAMLASVLQSNEGKTRMQVNNDNVLLKTFDYDGRNEELGSITLPWKPIEKAPPLPPRRPMVTPPPRLPRKPAAQISIINNFDTVDPVINSNGTEARFPYYNIILNEPISRKTFVPKCVVHTSEDVNSKSVFILKSSRRNSGEYATQSVSQEAEDRYCETLYPQRALRRSSYCNAIEDKLHQDNPPPLPKRNTNMKFILREEDLNYSPEMQRRLIKPVESSETNLPPPLPKRNPLSSAWREMSPPYHRRNESRPSSASSEGSSYPKRHTSNASASSYDSANPRVYCESSQYSDSSGATSRMSLPPSRSESGSSADSAVDMSRDTSNQNGSRLYKMQQTRSVSDLCDGKQPIYKKKFNKIKIYIKINLKTRQILYKLHWENNRRQCRHFP